MSRIQRIARRAQARRSPRIDSTWLPWTVYRGLCDPDQRGPLQSTVCIRTGAVWVKPLTGRCHALPAAELLERRTALAHRIEALGGSCTFPDGGDLAMTVEYLENVLEWELRPACGCEPAHSEVACA